MRRLKPTPALALLAVPLLLVGYVLSWGPADGLVYRLWRDDPDVWRVMDVIYAPLIWLCGWSPTINDGATAYSNWWVDMLNP